ncbi:MAG: inorganic phosphate transporter [Acidimicrobiales bacterium]
MEVALLGAALALAFVSGANDGATLAAMGTRTGALSVLAGVLVLALAVGTVPAVAGRGVAATLAHGLVHFEQSGGRPAFLAAAVGALLVVLLLSRRGLPTSVTLALNGSIIGAGVGAGLALSWVTIGYVLAAGLLGPLVAAAAGFAVTPLVRRLVGRRAPRETRARRLQRAGFLVQSFAYGANGAQKMVAFAAVAAGASLDPVRLNAFSQLAVAICFAAGALFAVRRLSSRVTEQLVRVRPQSSLSALLASSAVVLASSAVGIPLSSTQASTAGLLGSTGRVAPQRVRVHQVFALGVAWGATLPSAAALGAMLGLLAGWLR